MKTIKLLSICALSFFTFTALATSPISKTKILDKNTYYIAESGIVDHANPSIENSIAWYFKTYGAGKNYILNSSGAAYNVNSTVIVPANAVFKGNNAKGNYTLLASTGLDLKAMVSVKDSATLQFMTLDGNRKAGAILNVSNKKNVTVKNCSILNSKNDFTALNSTYSILINAQNTTDCIIEKCILKNAGANPKLNPLEQKSTGYAILMRKAINAKVLNNDISSTLTCGVDFTGGSLISIIGNRIADTGLNRQSIGPVADAITAYHNWNSTSPENFTISNNVITGANNHAIHVSGDGISIENNTISDYTLSGIMVDDWRSKANQGGANDNEFSQHVIIKNNKIVGDPKSWKFAPGNSNRKVYVDRVNQEMKLDYSVNQDSTGNLLNVTDENYHLPIKFGIH
jgi:hypothetical protein